MGKGKFGRGSARGARGGGKSMGISENACFTAVHSSAADYFAFHIKWDALYALSCSMFLQTRGNIAISRQLIIEVTNYFARNA